MTHALRVKSLEIFPAHPSLRDAFSVLRKIKENDKKLEKKIKI
jgi:hypothetical protein